MMNKELIKYNLPQISLNVSTITHTPGKTYLGVHYHSAIELVRVHSGRLTCHIGDMAVSLLPNDTLLINKNVAHSLEFSDSETKFSYMQIDPSRQLTSPEKEDSYYIRHFIDKSSALQYFIGNQSSQLSDIFDNIFSEFHSSEANTILYMRAYILQLIAFMHRYKLIKEPDSHLLGKLESIKPVIKYIANHYTDKIYIEDVALTININKFQLCKLFKSITGGSVVEYINFVRLHRATDMLLNSDKTVTEIAYSCGFSSIQYFNNIFNKNLGCSPKKFRSRMINL